MTKHKSVFVVIGTDKENKPRAARYHGRDAVTVAKAAALTGYRIARAVSNKARAAAKDLPEIQLFSSGRALVPRVRQPLFSALTQALTFPAAQPCKTTPAPQKRSADVPEELENLDGLVRNPWASIKQGSLVLAEEPEEGGWYEAVVVGQIQKGASVTLRWRDWPKLKVFTVARTALPFRRVRGPRWFNCQNFPRPGSTMQPLVSHPRNNPTLPAPRCDVAAGSHPKKETDDGKDRADSCTQ